MDGVHIGGARTLPRCEVDIVADPPLPLWWAEVQQEAS